jgi:hypothetical protein
VDDAIVNDRVHHAVYGDTNEHGQQPTCTTQVEAQGDAADHHHRKSQWENIVWLGGLFGESGSGIAVVAAMQIAQCSMHHKSVHQVGDGLHTKKTDGNEEDISEAQHVIYRLPIKRMSPSCTTDIANSPLLEKIEPPANPRALEVENEVWS